MKFAELIPLTAALVNFALTVFVLTRGLKASLSRVYLLWGAALVVWNVGVAMLFQVHDPLVALFWARFLQFGVIFMPIALFHLCLMIAQISMPRLLRVMYGLQIALALANCTGFFISGVVNVGYAYYSVAGIGFWIFTVNYLFLTWFAMLLLYKKHKVVPPLHRVRIKSLLLACGTLIFFGLNDILPILGLYYYPFTSYRIFPFGSLAAIVYGLLVGYSTLQHQLLDVQVSLSRLIAHSIRLAFMLVIGVSVLLVMILIAPHEFTWTSIFCSIGMLLFSGLLASVYFPRLFGSGEDAVERRLLGDRFEYHDQIRNFLASMQWYSDRNLLLNDLEDLLVKTVRVRSYEIILLDETTRVFSVFHAYPERPTEQLLELRTDSPVFRFFKESDVDYLAFNLLYGTPGATSLETEARESLQHFRAEFCFPFLSDKEPFGLMLLGEKNNQDPYTATDISLMVTLVKNLSLMINQIRLKNQIQHAQELELLGRMSRGMAHDLNNLLTPIWTLLQLVAEGASTEDLSDELLPVALRNIKTMRAYIRESLFFSENLRPDFQLGRLDMQITQAVDLTASRRANKEINVVADTPGEVLAEMDEVLIQRLIANIIANAVDASPVNSTIRVELVRLVKTEMHRDWLRVRVIDSGEGIKQENLDRIFTPYFTTKDRGDQDRGFGLGLAICRKIVNLHGGNLNVFSQLGKGTTVQIDLPSRQVKTTPSEVVIK